jgi:hypothetical protein
MGAYSSRSSRSTCSLRRPAAGAMSLSLPITPVSTSRLHSSQPVRLAKRQLGLRARHSSAQRARRASQPFRGIARGALVDSPYCTVPVMGLLLPRGVVQPFEILFSRDDLHVIVNLTDHPAYEAVEAMVRLLPGRPPRVRAIITRHDQTHIRFSELPHDLYERRTSERPLHCARRA